jgi:putative solute:sodium symporter small subunit
MLDASRHLFWKRTLRLTAGLLLAWLGINLAVPWFARDLNALQGFGFPAGYWLAAEGVLGLYLLIIVVYVVVMDRLEAGYLACESGTASAPSAGPEDARPGPQDAGTR